ncbi:MAG TPA: histidine triad nucleotide-binding protein [Ignavibacteriaceae bacterium]|nr:histidine triad nucleotide-binding protein [Ignavibacteriaceae bacterium]
MAETIFSKIIRKEIPAKIVFESDTVLAFHDIHPKAPIHILIIPKIEIPSAREINGREHAQLLGDLFDAANQIAEDFGVKENGFRLIFNCGPDGGQEVYHLHMHLLAGKKLGF